MDLSIFARSRAGFWAWVAIPIVLILGLSLTVRAYCRHVERTLAQFQGFVQVIPRMENDLASAREVADKLAVPVEAMNGVSERLRTRIGRTAQQCGFLVNSLSIADAGAEQGAAGGGGTQASASSALTVAVSGEGSLAALILFLDGLQSAESLMTVESVSVQKVRLVTQPLYSGAFVFRYSLVTYEAGRGPEERG